MIQAIISMDFATYIGAFATPFTFNLILLPVLFQFLKGHRANLSPSPKAHENPMLGVVQQRFGLGLPHGVG